MKKLLLLWCCVGAAPHLAAQLATDTRNIATGSVIPDESYSDQPYVIRTDDGAWLCVMTTAPGHEGAKGQHIVAQRSMDQGKTWGEMVAIEPSDGPEASYSVLLKAPSGRIFVFYNHNTDNTRRVIGNDPPFKNGVVDRVDCQGYYVFKYSDNHGRTWSKQRYVIPVREFDIDRNNPYGGKIRYFWNVGKAFIHNDMACVPLVKVGGLGLGFYTSDEGVLLQSPDLLTVRDPAKATWLTLPDGNTGIKPPAGGGTIAEEHSYISLSDGSLFCVYRTVAGFPGCSYSRDGGRSWSEPAFLTYADGRRVKHPRAANFVWKCENGKYLYWFHNHGGKFIGGHPQNRHISYRDRNPVWIAGGIEEDSSEGRIIRWSQPEVLLYDDDPVVRISYPDLLEDGGAYYVTETQKDLARVHKLDETLLEGLWGQLDGHPGRAAGAVASWRYAGGDSPQMTECPPLPLFYTPNEQALDWAGESHPNGFSVEVAFTLNSAAAGQVILDNRTSCGKGFYLCTTDGGGIELVIHDGQTQASWSCDPGAIKSGEKHHVCFIVDGGPKIITVVTDGILNDGGDARQFGWGRFSPYLKSADGAELLVIGQRGNMIVHMVNIYNRALRTSEAIGNHRFWLDN